MGDLVRIEPRAPFSELHPCRRSFWLKVGERVRFGALCMALMRERQGEAMRFVLHWSIGETRSESGLDEKHGFMIGDGALLTVLARRFRSGKPEAVLFLLSARDVPSLMRLQCAAAPS
jgi:hypothetical protein